LRRQEDVQRRGLRPGRADRGPHELRLWHAGQGHPALERQERGGEDQRPLPQQRARHRPLARRGPQDRPHRPGDREGAAGGAGLATRPAALARRAFPPRRLRGTITALTRTVVKLARGPMGCAALILAGAVLLPAPLRAGGTDADAPPAGLKREDWSQLRADPQRAGAFPHEAQLLGQADPPGLPGTGFGYSVSVEQDQVAVGAYRESA